MIKLDWTTFKAYAIAGALPLRGFEDAVNYTVYANDGGFTVYCELDKNPSDTTDRDDYVTNYKPTANLALSQYDTDGASIVRNKAAKKGWTFCSFPIEFATARLQTGNTASSDDLYAKDASGADRTFITQKVYDAGGAEITTPGVLDAHYADAVKTVIDFEPPYDYEVVGGELRTLTSITANLRLWLIAVPDIAAPTGSKEMGGGINLKYLSPGNIWAVDGRVTKYATYNATYHTNKLRLLFKYEAGTHENLQVVIQLYKL